MLQLSEGVHAIHEMKVIHRDLKPSNIFIDQQNQLIIGDFGIAIQKTKALTSIGTPSYAAPEQSTGTEYDNKVDMWALGCILLDLLTFTPSHYVVERRILSIPSSYNNKWIEAARSLLAIDPKARWSAKELGIGVLKIKSLILSPISSFFARLFFGQDTTPNQLLDLELSSFRLALFEQCAVSGDPIAQTQLGYYYELCLDEQDDFKDYKQVIKWYKLAAEKRHAPARTRLGFCYEHGYGVKQDYPTALRLFLASAKKGNMEAQFHLGFIFHHGFCDMVANKERALEWYKRSMEQGYQKAQENILLLEKS